MSIITVYPIVGTRYFLNSNLSLHSVRVHRVDDNHCVLRGHVSGGASSQQRQDATCHQIGRVYTITKVLDSFPGFDRKLFYRKKQSHTFWLFFVSSALSRSSPLASFYTPALTSGTSGTSWTSLLLSQGMYILLDQ